MTDILKTELDEALDWQEGQYEDHPEQPVRSMDDIIAEQDHREAQKATLVETLGAAYDQEWLLPNLMRWNAEQETARDPHFNWEEHRAEAVKDIPEDYHPELAEAESMEHLDAIRTNILTELENKRVLADSGWVGPAAQLGAALTDPVMLLAMPLEGAALAKGGYSALKTAARSAGVIGVSAAAQEASLVATSHTKDTSDIFYALAGGAALGGAVGGAARMLTNAADNHAINVTARALQDDVEAKIARETIIDVPLNNHWKMTRAEFAASNFPGAAEWSQSVYGRQTYGQGNTFHYLSVAKALREGKKVPDEVLADYPDIQDTIHGIQINEGSVGAMVADPTSLRQDIFNDTDDAILQAARKTKKATGTGLSAHHRMTASDNPMTRYVAEQLLENPAGTGGKLDRVKTAALYEDVFKRRVLGMFGDEYTQAYVAFAKSRGVGQMEMRFGGKLRNEFDRLIHKEMNAIEYGHPRVDDPNVNRVIKAIGDMNDESLRIMKQTGVHGADKVQFNRNHIARRWAGEQFIHFGRMVGGKERIVGLLTKGLRAANEEMDPKLAGSIAKAIFRRFKNKGAKLDADPGKMFNAENRGVLKELLEDGDMDAADIETIMHHLERGKKDAKTAGNLRKKLAIDMSVEHEGLSITDLLDINVEKTMNQYGKEMAGRSALAAKGIDSDRAWDQLMDRIRKAEADEGIVREGGAEEEIRVLEDMRKLMMGKSILANPDSTPNKFMRVTKDLSSMAALGQMGLAQLAEMGKVVATIGVRQAIEQIPALGRMFRDAWNGTMSDELLKDMECLYGKVGADHLIDPPRMRDTDGGAGVADSYDSATTTVLKNAMAEGTRILGYASGQSIVMSVEQQIILRGMAQKFFNLTQDASKANLKRMKDIGLNEKQLGQVLEEIKTHATTVPGRGQKVATFHMSKWNPEVADDFIMALSRVSAQAAQRNLIGETGHWMHSAFGSMVAQFRAFPLVAIEKQLKHSIRMHDTEALTTAMYSFGMASAIYIAKQSVNSIGMEGKQRQEFLEQRLDPRAIASGGINLVGQLPFLGELYSGIAAMTGTENYFAGTGRGRTGAARGINLGLDDVAASAGYLQHAANAVGGLRAVRPDYDYSQQDFRHLRAILPLNNVVGIKNVLNLIGSQLPEKAQ